MQPQKSFFNDFFFKSHISLNFDKKNLTEKFLFVFKILVFISSSFFQNHTWF